MKRVIGLLVVLLSLGGCSESEQAAPPRDGFDAERAFSDLRAQVELGPRPAGSPASARLTRMLARELREGGAQDVGIQRPWRNVVASIPGSQPGAIVVGAHHDTKNEIPGFVGANDGASGVAVVLELARALAARAPLSGPSIHLALFDAEETRGDRPFIEDGMRGSRQYVELAADSAQGTPPLDEIRAMVLFDLVGDCNLGIPREAHSDPELYAEFQRGARETGGGDSPAPFEGEAPGVLDDHIPFIQAGIPAVDLIDFSYGPGPAPGEWWHSPEDTLDKVCAASLDAVGEAALVALEQIG